MSAPQEITPQISTIKNLGIIAGGGNLPSKLLDSCEKQGIETTAIGFKDQTAPETMARATNHLWSNVAAAGKIINFFKSHNIKDLVMIGHVKRPNFSEMKPDFKAIQILSKIGFRALGDNDLLTALKKELEKEGFTLHGIHDFCTNLLIEEGALGQHSPTKEDQVSIDLGLKASQTLGALDIGQSVVVQNGMVLGVEGVEGTDALIERCAPLQQKGRGAILVKSCKPQQDKDLDLPTIGINTVHNIHKAGFSGIVAQASHVLIADTQEVIDYADQHNIFVMGQHIKQEKE